MLLCVCGGCCLQQCGHVCSKKGSQAAREASDKGEMKRMQLIKSVRNMQTAMRYAEEDAEHSGGGSPGGQSARSTVGQPGFGQSKRILSAFNMIASNDAAAEHSKQLLSAALVAAGSQRHLVNSGRGGVSMRHIGTTMMATGSGSELKGVSSPTSGTVHMPMRTTSGSLLPSTANPLMANPLAHQRGASHNPYVLTIPSPTGPRPGPTTGGSVGSPAPSAPQEQDPTPTGTPMAGSGFAPGVGAGGRPLPHFGVPQFSVPAPSGSPSGAVSPYGAMGGGGGPRTPHYPYTTMPHPMAGGGGPRPMYPQQGHQRGVSLGPMQGYGGGMPGSPYSVGGMYPQAQAQQPYVVMDPAMIPAAPPRPRPQGASPDMTRRESRVAHM